MATHTELRCLHLCSGYGGFELGLRLAGIDARTVAHVERDSYAAATLVARMEEAHLDPAPIWDDLTTFDSGPWRGRVDCITAGFPCQPFSLAGSQRGVDDERWLWPAIKRIICGVGPRFVFLENVPQLVRGGLPFVLADLAELGFNAEWGLHSAAEVGAPHKRERFWLLAHTQSVNEREQNLEERAEPWGDSRGDASGNGEQLADTKNYRRTGRYASGSETGIPKTVGNSGPVADTNSARREINWTARLGTEHDTPTGASSELGNTSGSEPSSSVSSRDSGTDVKRAGGRSGIKPVVGDTSSARRSEVTGSSHSDEAAVVGSQTDSGSDFTNSPSQDVADTNSARPEGYGIATDSKTKKISRASCLGGSAWPPTRDGDWAEYIAKGGPQPSVRRITNGPPAGLADTLHLGGNGLVPTVAAAAFVELLNRLSG